MMNKIWFTADQHFFHKNIIKYEDRPFRDMEHMNDEMFRLWNETVAPEDEVYVLGDLCFGPTHKSVELVWGLHGKKYLVIGNHDNKSRAYFIRFEWVRKMHTLKLDGHKLILCHYPIANWEGEEDGAIHLHGHSHMKGPRYAGGNEYSGPMGRISDYCASDYPDKGFRVNVGVDWWGFKPISLDEILERAQEEFGR